MVSNISGGSGTGLTAVADVVNGTLLGFQVTSPGQGYAAGNVLTFTVSGASTTATQMYTYTLQGTGTDLAANGTGGLTKAGAGALSLTGASTYAGNTNVSAGTLFANAPRALGGTGALTSSATGTGTVTVASGATLGGTGGTGPVVVNGIITAGPDLVTAGTLTTGTQTWNAGGGYVAKVTSAGSDQLVMSGLTITAMNTSSATEFTVYLNGSTGSTAVTAAGIVLANDSSGSTANNGVFQNSINAGSLVLVATNVATTSGNAPGLEEVDVGTGQELVAFDTAAAPEPASLLLLVGVAAAPLALSRRRRRAASGPRR